jgi:hypothetical protein
MNLKRYAICTGMEVVTGVESEGTLRVMRRVFRSRQAIIGYQELYALSAVEARRVQSLARLKHRRQLAAAPRPGIIGPTNAFRRRSHTPGIETVVLDRPSAQFPPPSPWGQN